jgi:two-component system, OmpR family, response regulator
MDGLRSAVVIEDDQDIRELITMVLSQSGFDVQSAGTGLDGVEAVRRCNPDIVTLDLGLPDIDGFEVARRIRQFSQAYIVMLTARADELDTLLGLETGADDYLTKPFRPRELRARVGAMLRRPRTTADTGAVPESASPAEPNPGQAPQPVVPAVPALPAVEPGTLEHSGLRLNGATRSVDVDGEALDLTRTEFDLLLALMESGKLVRTKAQLVRRLRGDSYDAGGYINDADERTVEVHMANLRRKLGDNPRSPRWIKTVRGVGYQLAT